MRKIAFLLIIIITFVFVSGLIAKQASAEDPFKYICNGEAASSSTCKDRARSTSNPLLGTDGIITKVIEILTIIIAVASVIMIMIGGFKYITSTGDSAKVNSAKDTILYAIIGLVVVVVARFVVSFVLRKL